MAAEQLRSGVGWNQRGLNRKEFQELRIYHPDMQIWTREYYVRIIEMDSEINKQYVKEQRENYIKGN